MSEEIFFFLHMCGYNRKFPSFSSSGDNSYSFKLYPTLTTSFFLTMETRVEGAGKKNIK